MELNGVPVSIVGVTAPEFIGAEPSPPDVFLSLGAAALMALMATLVFGYATEWKGGRGGWWPPFAVVALTLVFGVKFG